MNRSNNNKAVKYASTIDGCSGGNDIANRWHSHFEDLYNSVKDPLSESIFRARVPANVSVCSYTTFIQVSNIATACKNQKSDEATGPDDMATEALTYGTYGLFVHLAILFNLFINFSYLPNSFCLLYTSPSPRDRQKSRMPSSA